MDHPVIVIVPGAFHKPSHYERIVQPLRELGYTVLTPALVVCGDDNVDPEATHFDDVKAIHKVLLPHLEAGKQAVIVSHSYGSVPAVSSIDGLSVVDRAAKGQSGGVKAYINMAGFSFPARGKNIMGTLDESPVMPYHIVKNGFISNTEDAKQVFYSGLDAADADAAYAGLCKFHTRKSFNTWPTFICSDLNIPKTFILCEADQALPPEFQAGFAQVGRYENIVKLPSGHSPFLGMPDKVVDIIVGVAEKK